MMRRPVITDERMQVYLQREGDRAHGTVEFPHPTRGRVVVPIDYRRVDPAPSSSTPPAVAPLCHSIAGRKRGERPAPADGRQPTADSQQLSARAASRLAAVQLADKLSAAYGPRSRGAGLAKAVELMRSEHRFECTVRSIQLWARRLDVHGPQGLEDNYQPRPRTVLGCSADTAQKALTILGWWCYRIGNLAAIDSQSMHAAVDLVGLGWTVADMMTVIDCYAAYDCDRQVMPFKPWLRWARYDHASWALRAGVCADRRRLSRAAGCSPSLAGMGQGEGVPLAESRELTADSLCPPDTPTRRRMINASTARKALASRADRDGVAEAPPRIARSALDPASLAACGCGCGCGCGTGVSPVACGTGVSPVMDAGRPRPAPLADSRQPTADSSSPPATMAEALMDLDDRWRSLLLAAGRGERRAVAQAAETISFWWGQLPKSVTGPIDLRIGAWASTHPGVAPAAADRRRVQALAPHLTARGSDLTAARIAARSLAR